jgi:hypothetical protein
MKEMTVRKWLVLMNALVVFPALADEAAVRLKDGPDRDLVTARCVICHSLDYIQMNSAFLDRQGWEKSIDKMIKVMGAPVQPEEVAPIAAYLTRYYGR